MEGDAGDPIGPGARGRNPACPADAQARRQDLHAGGASARGLMRVARRGHMEPYRLRVPGRIEELLRSLHPELKRKVRAGLDLIRADPEVGKELRDELAGLRSLRVGRIRIVYRVAARRLIDLVAIGPRRTIYQETLRLLRRG